MRSDNVHTSESGSAAEVILPAVSQISYTPQFCQWNQYPHFHENVYEITFYVQGTGFLNLPSVSCPVSEGTIAVVGPRIPHFSESGEEQGLAYYNLHLGKYRSELYDILTASSPCCFQTGQMSRIVSLFQLISECFTENPGSGLNRFCQFLCTAILQAAADSMPGEIQVIKTQSPQYAEDILLYLQEHVEQKISMENLADHFSLSASHISRIFSQTYHISPIHYLMVCRMRKARSYMDIQKMPVKEIAARLGFHNTNHFVSAFTAFFGNSPDHYSEPATLIYSTEASTAI